MSYDIYLRKSRADLQAELAGEGESLKRHERLLLETAKKLGHSINKIYREIVSGESIVARPEMQRLLSEIEQGNVEGIYVVDIDRLTRGSQIDQGIIAQTLKYTNTLIITPSKIYDLNDESDETAAGFNFLMSNIEYKKIAKRLLRGREASAKEGKFIGSIAPFGYKRVKIEKGKGWTLEIIPEQADIIKYIFKLFTEGDNGNDRMEVPSITKRLHELGIKPLKAQFWEYSSLKDIIKNPVYAGKIKYIKRPLKSTIKNGQIKKTRPRVSRDYYMNLYDGVHPAIISMDTWNKSVELVHGKPKYVVSNRKIINPFAGLIVCGICDHKLILRQQTKSKPYLTCSNVFCTCISSRYEVIEKAILELLRGYLSDQQIVLKKNDKSNTKETIEIFNKSLKKINDEILLIKSQISETYDLLERKIYDTDTFLARNNHLSAKLNELTYNYNKVNLEVAKLEKDTIVQIDFIPKIKNIIEIYNELQDPIDKNLLLKEVISKIVYNKKHKTRWRDSPDNLKLTIHFK